MEIEALAEILTANNALLAEIISYQEMVVAGLNFGVAGIGVIVGAVLGLAFINMWKPGV